MKIAKSSLKFLSMKSLNNELIGALGRERLSGTLKNRIFGLWITAQKTLWNTGRTEDLCIYLIGPRSLLKICSEGILCLAVFIFLTDVRDLGGCSCE